MALTLSKGFWAPTVGGESTDDMIFISKATASSASGLEITSDIDSTYPIYKIFASNLITSVGSGPIFTFQVSDDGGTTYGIAATSVVVDVHHYQTGSSAGPQRQTGEMLANSTGNIPLGIGTNSTGHAGFEMTIYDPSDTTAQYKMIDCIAATCNDGTDYVRRYTTTVMVNAGTSAVDAIKFVPTSGTFSGVFTLYGMKDS